MKRIFLTLAVISTVILFTALVLGLNIRPALSQNRDAAASAIDSHMGMALFALIAAAMVHSIVLTYFMGTGRWMEETSRAYHLQETWKAESKSLKYRMIAGMTFCLVLLIFTGALGMATGTRAFKGFPDYGISAGTVHFTSAALAITLNLIVNVQQYLAISRNSQLVDSIMSEVRRIRTEKGLPV